MSPISGKLSLQVFHLLQIFAELLFKKCTLETVCRVFNLLSFTNFQVVRANSNGCFMSSIVHSVHSVTWHQLTTLCASAHRDKEKKYRKLLNKSTIVCTFWKSAGNCSQNIAINYTILGAIEVTEAHSMC